MFVLCFFKMNSGKNKIMKYFGGLLAYAHMVRLLHSCCVYVSNDVIGTQVGTMQW